MSVDIGERIRSLRTARGLSQEEVARRTGIGLKSYGDLERRRTRDPHYSTLRGVARALGVRVEELLEEPALAGRDEAPEGAGHRRVRDLQLKEVPTAELRDRVKALAGNQRTKTIEDLRTREGMQRAVAQSLVMHEATEIRAELLERGEEDPKAYLPDLRMYLDALDID